MATFSYTGGEYKSHTSDFSPLPKGKYRVKIAETSVRDNKNGTGKYIKLTYDIIDGEFAGRKLFDNINIYYPDKPQVELIAKNKLNGILHASGLGAINGDTDELVDKTLILDVGVKFDKYISKDANVIYEYLAENIAGMVSAAKPLEPAPVSSGLAFNGVRATSAPAPKGEWPF